MPQLSELTEQGQGRDERTLLYITAIILWIQCQDCSYNYSTPSRSYEHLKRNNTASWQHLYAWRYRLHVIEIFNINGYLSNL